MDAKAYLIKVNEICADFKARCGKDCPLNKYNCGAPEVTGHVDEVIDLVEHYKERQYPFGRCQSCKKGFNSELISEYGITHCPWCGQALKEANKDARTNTQSHAQGPRDPQGRD